MADKEKHDYSLVEPFDIDNGELDGIAPLNAFVLGVEWEMIRRDLESGGPVKRTAHTENASRIKRMCIRKGRKFRVEAAPDTQGQWAFLEVDAV